MQGLYLMITLAGIIIFIWFLRYYQTTKVVSENASVANLGDNFVDTILEERVPFYQKLSKQEKDRFIQRGKEFIMDTRFTPVKNLNVTVEDKWLIAASAIIPIFYFPDWKYMNLSEIIIYPNAFTNEYNLEDAEANFIGMVGEGAMNNTMILSLPDLRAGFDVNDAHNTGIHEFVHLIDKQDGMANGWPQYLMSKAQFKVWTQYMHLEAQKIREHQSDINPYAITNEAEFFAVLSEYYFEKPEELKEKHPQFFTILEQMFKPN